MRWIRGFGRFWWNFIVGDDPFAAAAIVVAIGVTAALAHSGVDAWWVMPVAVAVVLWLGLRREVSR
jgi:apolipoprotein N-acyltransferase